MTSPENQKGKTESPWPQWGGHRKMKLCHSVHVSRAQAFGPLRAFKLNGLTLIEGLVAVFQDGGEMNKHILSAGPLDESVTLGSIEPLHYTLFFHAPSPSKFGGHNGEVFAGVFCH